MCTSYVVERGRWDRGGEYQHSSRYAIVRKPYQESDKTDGGKCTVSIFANGVGRQVAFVASMGALGNVLALLTVSIPTPISQVAPDLSHVATLIVALYSGPVLGGITGALVSIVPFYRFGVTGWFGPIVGFLIIPLKSLTGITAGLLGRRLRPALATLLGYVPECIATYLYFMLVVPFFLPEVAPYVTIGFVAVVLTKAWFELTIIAIIMEAIKRRDVVARLIADTS